MRPVYDPVHTGLRDVPQVPARKVRPHRLVVDDGEEQEVEVRQHQEVRRKGHERRSFLHVPEVVQEDDQPEHEDGADRRPEREGQSGQHHLADHRQADQQRPDQAGAHRVTRS